MVIKINQAESVPIMHCPECDRVIPGDSALGHCDRCRPGYQASRKYLKVYTDRVRGGWLPDRTTPAPMTNPPIYESWMTAGDLADFNTEWQRAHFQPLLHDTLEVLAAFRYGYGFDKAETVVLLMGRQFPVCYFVVSASAKLSINPSSPNADEWNARKFPPDMPAREYVYDASFLLGGKTMPAEIAGNENAMPIRLTITFFAGVERLATVLDTYKPRTSQRQIKILAYHNLTLTANSAGVWDYANALRNMANHLETLARAGLGW